MPTTIIGELPTIHNKKMKKKIKKMKYQSTKKIVLKNAASMPLWDVNNKKKK